MTIGIARGEHLADRRHTTGSFLHAPPQFPTFPVRNLPTSPNDNRHKRHVIILNSNQKSSERDAPVRERARATEGRRVSKRTGLRSASATRSQ